MPEAGSWFRWLDVYREMLLIQEPMVPFLLLLEVHIPILIVERYTRNKCLAYNVRLRHWSSESSSTLGMAYNFGHNYQPNNLLEWGIPTGNNHSGSFGTAGLGEDNQKKKGLLLFLHFRDRGPIVDKGRLKQLHRRGLALLLRNWRAIHGEKQGIS